MVLGGLWHGASWAFIVWGALHGFGLAVTRYFQRRAGPGGGDARRDPAAARGAAPRSRSLGLGLFARRPGRAPAPGRSSSRSGCASTPLWAVLTAWLSREQPAQIAPRRGRRRGPAVARAVPPRSRAARARRARAGEPRAAAPGDVRRRRGASSPRWRGRRAGPGSRCSPRPGALGIAADAVERGAGELRARAVAICAAPRAGGRAGVPLRLPGVDLLPRDLVRQRARRAAPDRAGRDRPRQPGPDRHDRARGGLRLSTCGPTPAFAGCAAGSSRCRRGPRARLLAAVALVLRELGHTKIVPFIYFQF